MSKHQSNQTLFTIFLLLSTTVVLVFILIFAQSIFKPLAIGMFSAVILLPFKKMLERFVKFPALASFIALACAVLITVFIFVLLGSQVNAVLENIPSVPDLIVEAFNKVNELMTKWTGTSFSSDIRLGDKLADNSTTIMGYLGTGLSLSGSVLIFTLLCLISAFFCLWYAGNLKELIVIQFDDEERERVYETISRLQDMLVQYMSGLLYVSIIMFALNSLGLYLIGVDYSLLWGALAAILIIIPYIGTAIGGLLPMMYVLGVGDKPILALWIAIMYVGLQQLEGNFITPKIVGDAIKINPFVVIFSMLVGGLIWGITGIILSLPIIGVLRIMMMNFDPFKPIGSLISSDIQKRSFSIKEEYDEPKYRLSALFGGSKTEDSSKDNK